MQERKILASSRRLMAQFAFCLQDMEQEMVRLDALRRKARKLLRRFQTT
jgi:hypothetical protein